MGVTFVSGEVSGPSGKTARLDFLVDSGATYTLLPEQAWKDLGITARRTLQFRLADGTFMERDIGECRIDLEELGETSTPCILGSPEDQPLLGAVTLEELGLVLNPFSRTLYPMRVLLA